MCTLPSLALPREVSGALVHPLLDLTQRPVIGHRGNSAHAPENTLEAFRQAVALGVDALEFDVRRTADGVVVVLHDPTLDRTTDGSGRVDHLRLDEVRRADAGARFTSDRGASWPWRDRGLRVPTLEEVLQTFPDTPVLIEIKDEAAGTAVRDVILRHQAESRCVVASFDDGALTPFRGGPIAVGATRRDTARHFFQALLRLPIRMPGYRALSIPLSHRGVPLPVGGYVAALRAAGVPVHVWTVDEPAVARRLWHQGVCGILSNDPAPILAERAQVFGARR